VALQVYGELKHNGTVDQAGSWHAEAPYNINGSGLLRYAIGTLVPLTIECGFSKIIK
jgi:hypothetical protein